MATQCEVFVLLLPTDFCGKIPCYDTAFCKILEIKSFFIPERTSVTFFLEGGGNRRVWEIRHNILVDTLAGQTNRCGKRVVSLISCINGSAELRIIGRNQEKDQLLPYNFTSYRLINFTHHILQEGGGGILLQIKYNFNFNAARKFFSWRPKSVR